MITKLDEFLNESLIAPGIEDSFEFIFRDYAKLYNKWVPISFEPKNKKPELLTIIKKVHKKFIGYNSKNFNYSLDELIQKYIEYRIKESDSYKNSSLYDKNLESTIAYYGIDTLPDKYLKNIK